MNRFLVEKEIEFDAGHRVPEHESKCRNPHGHRYRVIVGVSGPLQQFGSSTGMVLDFAEIKQALVEVVHDPYDHAFVVSTGDVGMLDFVEQATRFEWKIVQLPFSPTAENLAREFFVRLAPILDKWTNTIVQYPKEIQVEYVKVYETPTSMAMYPYASPDH